MSEKVNMVLSLRVALWDRKDLKGIGWASAATPSKKGNGWVIQTSYLELTQDAEE
jgi:hypothetical protein